MKWFLKKPRETSWRRRSNESRKKESLENSRADICIFAHDFSSSEKKHEIVSQDVQKAKERRGMMEEKGWRDVKMLYPHPDISMDTCRPPFFNSLSRKRSSCSIISFF
jgi:hypothetical protein